MCAVGIARGNEQVKIHPTHGPKMPAEVTTPPFSELEIRTLICRQTFVTLILRR